MRAQKAMQKAKVTDSQLALAQSNFLKARPREMDYLRVGFHSCGSYKLGAYLRELTVCPAFYSFVSEDRAAVLPANGNAQ